MGILKTLQTIIQNTQSINVNSSQGSLDHLMPNGDLPFGWCYQNKSFTDDISSKYSYFLHNYLDAKEKTPQEEYGAIKSFIIFMEEAQAICHGKGECFAKWFDDCVADQEFIDKHKRRMSYIENNIDKLCDEYKRKEYIEKNIVPHLKNDLLKIITENPDILQKEIYKRFDPDVREYISQTLYHMEKDFYIIREKSGNTYKLNIMK